MSCSTQDWEAKNFIVAWENEENLISKKTSSVVTSLSESDVRDAEYARSLFLWILETYTEFLRTRVILDRPKSGQNFSISPRGF